MHKSAADLSLVKTYQAVLSNYITRSSMQRRRVRMENGLADVA